MVFVTNACLRNYAKMLEHYSQFAPSALSIKQFVDTLLKIRTRHMNVVETMAQGLNEMKETYGDNAKMDGNIQYFLDRFFLSRISIRMLITQHTMMFGGIRPDHPRNVGCIDPHCDVKAVLQDAFENARFVCENHYLVAPNVEIETLNVREKGNSIQVVHVPSHLYHMLFELFKNALRATIEFNGVETETFPPIKALIVKGKEDLTIKISDQGGGVPLSKYGNLFQYTYSTAPRPSIKDSSISSPLAGYGFGLPLSRLYARYFQGDLKLVTVEGYGMDAIVYLKVLPSDASELLPVFNKAVTKIYTSATPIGVYSGSPLQEAFKDTSTIQGKVSHTQVVLNNAEQTTHRHITSSLEADCYLTNPDVLPKAYEPPLSQSQYTSLLKRKYGDNPPQHLLDLKARLPEEDLTQMPFYNDPKINYETENKEDVNINNKNFNDKEGIENSNNKSKKEIHHHNVRKNKRGNW